MVKLPFKLNLKRKKASTSFLTVDIGSQTVKSMAFVYETVDESTDPVLKLVGIGKEWLEPYSVRGGNIIDIDNVAKALDNSIFKATEGLEHDIDDVIFGVSGDICTCLVTTAKINRGKTTELDKKELKEIEKKIMESAIGKAQELNYKKTGDDNIDLELITTSTVYTLVDGNNQSDLLGTTGKKVETALFTAFTPTYYLSSLEELGTMLGLNIMAVTSNLYALTESLKISEDTENLDGVIIEVGSDTTDVAVVFGGGIVTSRSLNIGGNQFTKQLSTETGLNFAEAEKRKYDYTFGNLSDADKLRMENDLGEITNLWLRGLELLFSEFEGVKTFASEIYLTGGGSKLPLIKNGLENKPWTKSIPFREPPEFRTISGKKFKHVFDTVGDTDKAEYVVPLALSVIYLELGNSQ